MAATKRKRDEEGKWPTTEQEPEFERKRDIKQESKAQGQPNLVPKEKWKEWRDKGMSIPAHNLRQRTLGFNCSTPYP